MEKSDPCALQLHVVFERDDSDTVILAKMLTVLQLVQPTWFAADTLDAPLRPELLEAAIKARAAVASRVQ